jgi:hypothetical protein
MVRTSDNFEITLSRKLLSDFGALLTSKSSAECTNEKKGDVLWFSGVTTSIFHDGAYVGEL